MYKKTQEANDYLQFERKIKIVIILNFADDESFRCSLVISYGDFTLSDQTENETI